MMEDFDPETEVVLEIENTPIKCNKKELIQHSDYFKVMFEGNFVERNKKVVKLEGIDLKAMDKILLLLWDRENTVLIEKEEDIMPVLQVSSMLQFIEIKTMCMERLTQLLSPNNCIKVWLLAEQLDLKPLYLKAKNMALMEFQAIRDTHSILELELKQLYNYLANTSLQCKSELDVFEVCMKWWYENSLKLMESQGVDCKESFRKQTFLCLLSCLDFKTLSNSDLEEMMVYPDLSEDCETMNILRCIINIRNGIETNSNEYIINKAKMFLKSKSRSCKQLPCILAHGIVNEPCSKKQKTSSSEENCTIYYNKFARKRFYASIGSLDSPTAIIYYDEKKHTVRKLLNIEKPKSDKLEGFQIIGYKELIFLFGGESVLGLGNWNKNFWVYDTIRECWSRRSVMPYVRRHFQSCVSGNYLYVIGGTGNFRVIQENFFWYIYKEDTWSPQVKLPCCGRQIKCCCWNDQLFILNINEKCGYLFDHSKLSWCKMNINDNTQSDFCYPDKYALFSYKNSVYIKGNSSLIEMIIKDQQLVVVKHTLLENVDSEEIDVLVCSNVIYALYKQTCPSPGTKMEPGTFTLEKYDMDLEVSEFIFRGVNEGTPVFQECEQCVLGKSPVLFGFQHHELVASDNFVTEL